MISIDLQMSRSDSSAEWRLDIGANIHGNETSFRVWAPFRKKVDLVLLNEHRTISLAQEERGYFSADCKAKSREDYFFILDKKTKCPDPVSRFQSKGVHGPSRIIDPEEFSWTDDNWRGIAKKDLIIYEVHTGTFTENGDFDSMIKMLPYLHRELGITALEIMPVAQFPGRRNWGYDGTFLYATQNSYGGPVGLKRLVDACHAEGLAFILDVVYNHGGPEGNWLPKYGPYFSKKYHTPWGPTLNYDDWGSDEVRHYVVENALYWIFEYHVDGLRLDAIHGVFDFSPKHILLEISERTHSLAESVGRQIHLIAESDLNDPRVLEGKERGGYEMDMQWSDDFHHSVHAYLTGERKHYYQDFGQLGDISKSLKDGFVYDGGYSKFRGRKHGASSAGFSGDKFVIFMQDHDLVGNRPGGERLSKLVSREKLKLAAALYLLSPNIPMLFMGEEYAETSPFYYFIEHSNKELIEVVRKGRKTEIKFDKQTKFIDPQSPSTFTKSKIDLNLRRNQPNKEVFQYYQQLITLRKSHDALLDFDRSNTLVKMNAQCECIFLFRRTAKEELFLAFTFGDSERIISNPVPNGSWSKIHDSSGRAPAILNATDSGLAIPPTAVVVYSRSG